MSATARAIIAGVGFVVIFVSGVWLSRAGRPLNVGISTIHKLISLAAAVFLLLTFYQAGRVTALSGEELIAVVVTGLLFLGSGISGALQSGDRPAVMSILRVHQILPVLTVLSSAVALYLLGAP